MIDPINGNSGYIPVDSSIQNNDKSQNKSFSKMLNEGLNKVNQLQVDANQKSRDFALGKIDNIHDVTVATEKAKLALNLTLAVQNKVVDAYKKVMRIRV